MDIKKIKITRNTFDKGALLKAGATLDVGKNIDKQTAAYLIRIGKAVPAGKQTKESAKK